MQNDFLSCFCILPFCIQVIAITLFIILVAQSRTKANGGSIHFRQMLTKQFHKQKELYITPIIIILYVVLPLFVYSLM
jgi:hypothetical protein